MSDELKPCPFCGGEAQVVRKPYETKFCVGCDDDTCLGFSGLGWLYDSDKEATEAWNRRAERMSQSKWVRVGSVRRFDHVDADKAQALKVLEEVVEVVEAWKDFDEVREDEIQGYGEPHDWTCVARNDLLDECADVIQATLNLVAALGVEDFRPYMKECERRNRERGRIKDGRSAASSRSTESR